MTQTEIIDSVCRLLEIKIKAATIDWAISDSTMSLIDEKINSLLKMIN